MENEQVQSPSTVIERLFNFMEEDIIPLEDIQWLTELLSASDPRKFAHFRDTKRLPVIRQYIWRIVRHRRLAPSITTAIRTAPSVRLADFL